MRENSLAAYFPKNPIPRIATMTSAIPTQFLTDILSFKKICARTIVTTGYVEVIGEAIDARVKLKETKRNNVPTAVASVPQSKNV